MKKKLFFSVVLIVSLLASSAGSAFAATNDGPDEVYLSEGPVFTWDYVGTQYGDNTVTNEVSGYTARVILAAPIFKTAQKIPSSYWKNIFAWSGLYGVSRIPSPNTEDVWWTTKKYVDTDAYNVYTRYEIKIYSDRYRTNLLTQYSKVEKN